MLQEFIAYIKTEKRYSANTLRAYEDDIRQYYAHVGLAGNGVEDASYFTSQLIRGWVATLMKQGVAASSVKRKLSSLSSFFKYLLRKGVITSDPMQKVVAPKQAKRLPVFLDEGKLGDLLTTSHTQEEPTYEQVRNYSIVELLYATGIRLSELVSLNCSSVDFLSCTLKVLGKGSKERFIPLAAPTCDMLKEYMQIRSKFLGEYSSEVALFLTSRCKPIYHRLVYSIVKQQLSVGGFTGKKSPHVLRHTFATHMLNNGADLNAIKDLLGHSGLGATQVYTHSSFEQLKRIHKNTHPRS